MTRGARWALPVVLLVAEYLALSFLIDMTGRTDGLRWVAFYRIAAPVSIGTIAAGWLVSRSRGRRDPTAEEEPPPWHPWPGLLGNVAVFAIASALAWVTLGPDGQGSTGGWALPTLLVLGVVAVVLAATTVGPLDWLLRRVQNLSGALPAAFSLGLVAWWVTSSVDDSWGLLSNTTLQTVGAMLRLSGGEVVVLPAEFAVGLDGFEVEIAPVCSGVDGIALFLLFEALWLALARNRLRFPRSLVLLPLGAAAAFIANAVRLATLIWVGSSGHEAIALGGLHSKLGWILSVALALGSVALAERTPWFHRLLPGSPEDDAEGTPASAGAFLWPLLAALTTALLTGIWAQGSFDRLYGARIAVAAAVLVALRRRLPSLRPSGSLLPGLAGGAVALLWVATARAGDATLPGALAGLGGAERWSWLAVRVIGSIVVVPIVEELAFRGFLMPWLVSPDFEEVPPHGWTWPSVLLSSLAFGAIHSHFLLGTVAGIAFAFARIWRGRLGDAIIAHAVANAGIAFAVIAGGRWALW